MLNQRIYNSVTTEMKTVHVTLLCGVLLNTVELFFTAHWHVNFFIVAFPHTSTGLMTVC